MRNLYTCDNCLYNPSQYQAMGTQVGYCLKYNYLLKHAAETTCRLLKRKDLPVFLASEAHEAHALHFASMKGIVFYETQASETLQPYSVQQVWLNNQYDPYLHEVAIYHKVEQKWTFIQAFMSSRNPIKALISTALTRKYIQQCGAKQDNYQLILSLANDLTDNLELTLADFREPLTIDEFIAIKENYLKDIALLKLYAIQEYGALIAEDKIMWISDELNASLLNSWAEFYQAIKALVPMITTNIIASAKKRKTFFPEQQYETI